MIGRFGMPMGGGGRGLLDIIGAGGGLDQLATKIPAGRGGMPNIPFNPRDLMRDRNMMTCPMCGGTGKVPAPMPEGGGNVSPRRRLYGIGGYR